MYDLVIKNGRVVTSGATFAADVAIQQEQIAAIGLDLSGKKEYDAAGKYVIPGGVDIHVHLQMQLGDGVASADDFFTGTRAAAFGGTTTIVDFVEASPEQSMVEAIAQRRSEADPKVVIDYGLHMTLAPSDIAKLEQIPEAYQAGCASFKMYMAYAVRLTDDQLLPAFEAIRGVGGFPVIHAENWDVIQFLAARHVANGHTTPHWHPRSRPASMEGEAVGRVIDLATMAGTPVHIFHVSCAEAVERIAAARHRGLPVTGETCPQYLFLTQEAYDVPGLAGALPVCAPPIREKEQQEALWQALARGDLQIVTTDHCPFVRADKARGRDDFRLIPGGVPSIEMRLTAIYSGGVKSGRLSLNQWVDACCTMPAKLVDLKNKGDIAVGYDADIVIFDPEGETDITLDTLHEQVDWTPYEGLVLHGKVDRVFSRGQLIVDDREFLSKPGHGRFINRAL